MLLKNISKGFQTDLLTMFWMQRNPANVRLWNILKGWIVSSAHGRGLGLAARQAMFKHLKCKYNYVANQEQEAGTEQPWTELIEARYHFHSPRLVSG